VPFCLAWAACVSGCHGVRSTGRVSVLLPRGVSVSFNVVGSDVSY
jgi:hypothetical protein